MRNWGRGGEKAQRGFKERDTPKFFVKKDRPGERQGEGKKGEELKVKKRSSPNPVSFHERRLAAARAVRGGQGKLKKKEKREN